jgi:hypothetical protein
MPTNNSWNSTYPASVPNGGSGVGTITGVITGNGMLPFTASTLTQYYTLVGGSSNAISSISTGISGQVLASNGIAANPSYQSIGTLGAITTITGNDSVAESPNASGNFNIVGTGSITTVGSLNTETVELTGLTNHNVLVGAGTATITKVAPSSTSGIPLVSNGSSSDPSFTTAVVAGGGTGLTTLTAHNVLLGEGTSNVGFAAPSATSGIPLISQGSSSDPVFGTAVVAGGGTGDTSFTAYSVICGGTTSTGALQNVSGVGTANQVLTSNGAGALPTWQAASGGKSLTVVNQVFTSTGTYTPTANMVYCQIQCLGGGGAGGGAAATNGSQFNSCGGGGAGEYAVGIFSAATIGASKSVTIGAGGTGNSGATGGNGGNTSVGSTVISANGGSGGVTGASAGNGVGAGGAGGTGGTGGDYRTAGQSGLYGLTGSLTAPAFSGQGASSQLGAGGQAQINTTGTGSAAAGYGAGGAGALNLTSQSASTGRSGTAGIVIVTEYVFG